MRAVRLSSDGAGMETAGTPGDVYEISDSVPPNLQLLKAPGGYAIAARCHRLAQAQAPFRRYRCACAARCIRCRSRWLDSPAIESHRVVGSAAGRPMHEQREHGHVGIVRRGRVLSSACPCVCSARCSIRFRSSPEQSCCRHAARKVRRPQGGALFSRNALQRWRLPLSFQRFGLGPVEAHVHCEWAFRRG
jgi:hypothetical protein